MADDHAGRIDDAGRNVVARRHRALRGLDDGLLLGDLVRAEAREAFGRRPVLRREAQQQGRGPRVDERGPREKERQHERSERDSSEAGGWLGHDGLHLSAPRLRHSRAHAAAPS